MLAIISQMAALFILILVGYGAAKLKIIDGRFSQQLSVFVINISSPCLIVSSVMGDISPDKGLILPVLAIGCVTYAFFVAVAMLLSRIITKNKDMQGIYGFMLTFGNVGFIGYPIVASIFGKYAIFYASLLNIPFTLLAFSLGKKMIQGGPGGLKLDWKILVSPAMIACYLSTLIVVFDIKGLPNLITTPILENTRKPGHDSLLPVNADSGVRHKRPAESGNHSDNPARKHHGPRGPADNRYIHGPDGPAADFLGKTGLGYLGSPAVGPADSHLLFYPSHRLQR